jgi:hypothetical protein
MADVPPSDRAQPEHRLTSHRSIPGRGGRRPPRKGISPILLPGDPTSSIAGRILAWLRGLLSRRPPRYHPPETVHSDLDRSSTSARGLLAPSPDASRDADPIGSQDEPVHRTTTQMLPGRLEPLNPEIVEQEVRFLKTATPWDSQSVTLGWELGSPPEHVTLDHPSIEAIHARMIYQRGHWMIETLARSDPVEINEALLLAEGVPYLLSDGDQVRIGKALFRYRFP